MYIASSDFYVKYVKIVYIYVRFVYKILFFVFYFILHC